MTGLTSYNRTTGMMSWAVANGREFESGVKSCLNDRDFIDKTYQLADRFGCSVVKACADRYELVTLQDAI